MSTVNKTVRPRVNTGERWLHILSGVKPAQPPAGDIQPQQPAGAPAELIGRTGYRLYR